MPILERIPNKKRLRSSLRMIQDTAIAPSDSAAVQTLWDSAQQLWGLVRKLEQLRTKNLVGVYARGCSAYRQMAPPPELGTLQRAMAEENRSQEERDEIAQTIRSLCTDYVGRRQRFEDEFIDTVVRMRNYCHSLAESDLADCIIEIYGHKAEEMQKEFLWAQNSIKPLILDLQQQLASVDKSISEIASKNFFDRFLELMPGQSTINGLALPVSKLGDFNFELGNKPPLLLKKPENKTTATQPDSPAPNPVAGGQPDVPVPPTGTSERTQTAVESVQTETPINVAIVEIAVQPTNIASSSPVPATPSATPGAGNTVKKVDYRELPTQGNLSGATPEAVLLKAAYETLQNGLRLFSTGTNLYKLVTKYDNLRTSLMELQQKYDESLCRYHELERQLTNLERVRVVLNHVSAYQSEIELPMTTLKAYADALASVRGDPAVYFEIFRLLMDYLGRLELTWR